MTERDALYRAILAEPDDDVARMVFADWLQERGEDDRAEFIRLQVGIAEGAIDAPDRAALRLRERELWISHGVGWMAELPVLPGITWGRLRRGFAEQIDIEGWPVNLAEAFAAAPVRELYLASALESIETLFDSDDFARVRGLGLPVDVRFSNDELLARLAATETASGLRSLNLIGTQVGDEGVLELAASPHLSNLVELSLGNTDVDIDGALAVCRSERLPALRSLDLSGVTLVERNMTRLAAEFPAGLIALGLNSCGLGRNEFWDLVSSPGLAGLRALDVSGNPLGSGLGAVARLTPQLVALDLAACGITAADLSGVCSPGRLGSVRSLRLGYQNLGGGWEFDTPDGLNLVGVDELDLERAELADFGTTGLCRVEGFVHLRRLTLSENRIGEVGASALASARFTDLASLDLGRNLIDDAGARALFASPNLGRLIELDLSYNRFGDRALETLAGSGVFERLVLLNLSGTSVTEAAARRLIGSKGLPRLRNVILTGDDSSPPGRGLSMGPNYLLDWNL